MHERAFCRPNPDELLRLLSAQELNESRGRLKIFLGYASRVGKSLRMFEEGRRRQERGQDVIVGAVQAKGSGELAEVLSGLEVVPLLHRDGRDYLDVEAVLKRRPQVCLVDELASDNPPGPQNRARWQDVEEILEHGITVVTAINLQHIREQQDAVERITGKRARNCVPEAFIRCADEFVLVDAPVADFSELREVALLLAAEVVESQLQRYLDLHHIQASWGTQERILVCITPHSDAATMMQSGKRSAERFHGQLVVAYVAQDDITREDQENLDRHLELARRLGVEYHALQGRDPIGSIIEFARAQRVTQIFVGHSRQSSWRFWAANPLDRLIEAADGIDVRIFPHPQNA